MNITLEKPGIDNVVVRAKELSHRNLLAIEGDHGYARSRREFATLIYGNRPGLLELRNANSLDSALSRQVFLHDMLEAYTTVVSRLDVFSTVWSDVPMQGNDKIEVSYFPLQGSAANSFSRTTGYNTSTDWVQQSREISVGGDGVAATSGSNAAAGTARDRKYISLNFTSYDIDRQPALNASKLMQQAGNKLGVDVFSDIVGRVVTRGFFGNAVKSMAAASFSADDVADLREKATAANWPGTGRNLVLNHIYYTPLLKDTSFKTALAYGSTDPIQMGRIQNAYGFENIMEIPNLTSYTPAGENTVGWINHKSAVLIATANIKPTPAVMKTLGSWEIFTHPGTGISFSVRKQGNAVLDQESDIVECSYGAVGGLAAALNRIVSTGT